VISFQVQFQLKLNLLKLEHVSYNRIQKTRVTMSEDSILTETEPKLNPLKILISLAFVPTS
jgi:hypothetical protein